MSTLAFGGEVRSKGLVLYPCFEQPGRWILLPHALDIGKRPDGTPDFQLDLVRSRDAGLAGYGVIDFRLVPVLALAAARQSTPGGFVEAGSFSAGWLRLLVRDPGASATTVVLPPLRIASNGLGIVRLAAQLTATGASLLKQALLGGTVLADAWAEMEIRGMAARAAANVTFRAADLAKAVPPDPKNGTVTRAAVVTALASPGILQGVPAGIDLRQAAEATADRLRNLAVTQVPSSEQDFAESWRLNFDTGDTRYQFDLGSAVETVRNTALRFDPVGMTRDAAGPSGMAHLVVERELDDFATGYVPVLVSANLVNQRSPVLSCGVDIVASAKPPNRPGVIRESIEFQSPADRKDVVLRFAADEQPQYQFETFVLAETDASVREWRSPRKDHSGSELRLTMEDFAARFVPVTASPEMLGAGTVLVSARWGGESETVTLSPANPCDALVYDSTAQKVTFDCVLKAGGRELKTALPAAAALLLDITVFPEYGSHSVQIEIDFTGWTSLVALDLTPEDQQDRPAATVSFTPDKPNRTWTWFAKSPFAPGFRYRVYQAVGAAREWSATQSPFDALRLNARDLAAGRAAGQNG